MDLLPTMVSSHTLFERVSQLGLSAGLEDKFFRLESSNWEIIPATNDSALSLTADEEKELATEVLLYRHRFTELLLATKKFRQASLSVIQNIYLFRNRRIFFSAEGRSTEEERQEALLLFSSSQHNVSVPLAKSLQHMMIARIWNRICQQANDSELDSKNFTELHQVVERLNTVRNIYMLLTLGLVRRLATRINKIYRESVSYEDAVQIGSFGVARAAYRYHQSSGVRFSTFAANWIFKEIQRQALGGRLIRISANSVEQYAKANKSKDCAQIEKYTSRIEQATIADTTLLNDMSSQYASGNDSFVSPQSRDLEFNDYKKSLLEAVEKELSPRTGDIVKRRYGLPPYQGQEQSVISISEVYGVTRSNIYQLEQAALKKLQNALTPM